MMVRIVDRDQHLGSMGAKGKGGGNVKEQEYAKMKGMPIAPNESGEWREMVREYLCECGEHRAAAAEFKCWT